MPSLYIELYFLFLGVFNMDNEQEKLKGEFKITYFNDKILSVYRRCSCGGDVKITVNREKGTRTAVCQSCGNTLTWGGKDK